MGSPLGPLMANVFMCHLEEKLTRDDLMPHLHRRYVDDTLARMSNTDAATMFLTTLSAVARGGAGGAHAPPVFLLESKNRPV